MNFAQFETKETFIRAGVGDLQLGGGGGHKPGGGGASTPPVYMLKEALKYLWFTDPEREVFSEIFSEEMFLFPRIP